MLWPEIRKFGKEFGLKRTGSMVLGEVKNCFVRVYEDDGKVLEVLSPEMDDEDKEAISNILKQNKVKNHELSEDGIKIKFTEIVRSGAIGKIRIVMAGVTEYFERKYPGEKPRCQRCGLKKDAEAYCVGGESPYLCHGCLKAVENELNKANLEYQEQPGNYLRGFVGALLFSLPGIAVTALIFIFLDRLAALSAALYIFLAVKGYRVFKGKISPVGAVFVTAVGIIMTGVGVVAAYSAEVLLYVWEEWGVFQLDILPPLFALPDAQREILANLVGAYLVSFVYLAIWLHQMAKEWKFSAVVQKPRNI
ncbi:MAG: hypothetical protein LBP30_06760 [Clostridiales Family XIII bacterium]|jgi:hypothetical protein|nr:hypothetical protein [Clostridiales Family XIII bacterium]